MSRRGLDSHSQETQREKAHRHPAERASRRHTPVLVAASVLLAIGCMAGSAFAFLTSSTGGAQVGIANLTSNGPEFNVAVPNAWENVPGAVTSLTVPAGGITVNARFTAESACWGPGAGWCSARIIAIRPGLGGSELNPISVNDGQAAPNDFHFDSNVPGGGVAKDEEGHAMERSKRLAPGVYTVYVQVRRSNAATKFKLDYWNFSLERSV